MSDYKQRFRERFWLHRVPRNTKQMADILAFIDEENWAAFCRGAEAGVIEGEGREREALIAHVERMKWPLKRDEENEYYKVECNARNRVLDDILNFLREPEKKVQVKTFLTGGKVTKVTVNRVELLPSEYHVDGGSVFLNPQSQTLRRGAAQSVRRCGTLNQTTIVSTRTAPATLRRGITKQTNMRTREQIEDSAFGNASDIPFLLHTLLEAMLDICDLLANPPLIVSEHRLTPEELATLHEIDARQGDKAEGSV